MVADSDDTILVQVDKELRDEVQEEHHDSWKNNEEIIQEEIIRDVIMAKMWINYIGWLKLLESLNVCYIA